MSSSSFVVARFFKRIQRVQLPSSSTRFRIVWQTRVVGLGILLVVVVLACSIYINHEQLLVAEEEAQQQHAAIQPFHEQLQQHRSKSKATAQGNLLLQQQQQQQQQRQDEAITLKTNETQGSLSSSSRQWLEEKKHNNKARISFELRRGFTFNNTFNPLVTCHLNDDGKRLPLHREMHDARGVLDFTTHIATDLKILIMGDSVGMQFSQGLEEATGVKSLNSSTGDIQNNASTRTVYRYAWGEHEGLHLSAPVRGGGVVAGWRITDFFQRNNQNQPLPNSPGGGWVMDDVKALLQHEYLSSTSAEDNNRTTTAVQAFDVLVFRIPHGWIELTKITVEALTETIQLAHELFRVSNVVFVSLPFVNNIVKQWQLDMLDEKNALLRDFAHTYNSNTTGGVRHISVMEFGHFADALMEWNANIIGMNTSTTTAPDDEWKMKQLRCCPHQGYRRHIAHICGELVPNKAPRCNRNSVSYDGMHWCMETIAGRLYAGLSCLIGCTFNGEEGNETTSNLNDAVTSCEQRCNDDYMSLTPIDSARIN